MNDGKLFSLKPEFISQKNLILNSLVWLPISVAAGVEAAVIYVASTNGHFPALLPYSIIPAASIFVLLMVLGFFNEKNKSQATDYSVYDNRIEFSDGFLNTHVIHLMLEDVKEIHLRRSVFQKKWDLGTIRFVTVANVLQPTNLAVHTAGTVFRDIKNSTQVFTEMKNLIEKQKKQKLSERN